MGLVKMVTRIRRIAQPNSPMRVSTSGLAGVVPIHQFDCDFVILLSKHTEMSGSLLAKFYERDLNKLIEEINLFKSEENLWKTAGSVKNSSGNLVLHIIGGSNYLIGAKLSQTGYVRNRDLEFTRKDVARDILVSQLQELIAVVTTTLSNLTPGQMETDYPIPFDDATRSKSYVLVQLLAHLNYHLGQVNYLRRVLE
jgi:hypothetical protein